MIDRSMPDAGKRVARSNLRTALALASVAAVFFVGVFVARLMGNSAAGFTLLGVLIIAFLAFAIGRNLRNRE